MLHKLNIPNSIYQHEQYGRAISWLDMRMCSIIEGITDGFDDFDKLHFKSWPDKELRKELKLHEATKKAIQELMWTDEDVFSSPYQRIHCGKYCEQVIEFIKSLLKSRKLAA